MNQIAASILVLASAAFGYTAVHTIHEVSTLFGAAALASGLSGLVSLIASILPPPRDLFWSGYRRWDTLDRVRDRPLSARGMAGSQGMEDGLTVRLPADIKNQLNYLANVRGQDRDQVVQELLRRNLASSARATHVA